MSGMQQGTESSPSSQQLLIQRLRVQTCSSAAKNYLINREGNSTSWDKE